MTKRVVLVALVATAIVASVAFVRSIWRDDEMVLFALVDARRYNSISITSEHGELALVLAQYTLNAGHTYLSRQQPSPAKTALRHLASGRTKDMSTLFDRPRIFENPIHSAVDAGVTDKAIASAPDITIAAVTLIWPLWTYRKYRRDVVRSRLGKCRRCGYDLRATPGICPECGPLESSS